MRVNKEVPPVFNVALVLVSSLQVWPILFLNPTQLIPLIHYATSALCILAVLGKFVYTASTDDGVFFFIYLSRKNACGISRQNCLQSTTLQNVQLMNKL